MNQRKKNLQVLDILYSICLIVLWSITCAITGWAIVTSVVGIIFGAIFGIVIGKVIADSVINIKRGVTNGIIIVTLVGILLPYLIARFSETSHLVWLIPITIGATVGAYIGIEFHKSILNAKQGAIFGVILSTVVGIILMMASITQTILYNDWTVFLRAVKWSILIIIISTLSLSILWAGVMAIMSAWANQIFEFTDES